MFPSCCVMSDCLFHHKQTGLHWDSVRGKWGLYGSRERQYKVPVRAWPCPRWPAVLHLSVPSHTHSHSHIVWNNGRRLAVSTVLDVTPFTARAKQWGWMENRVYSPALKSFVLWRALTTQFVLCYCFVKSRRQWQKVWKAREHGVLPTLSGSS